MTTFNNIAGTLAFRDDGNLAPEPTSSAPRVCIVGTAAQGTSDAHLVRTTSVSKTEFGTEGTLLRGMWEAKAAGAQEIMLLRIGATAAIVQYIGIDDAAITAGTGGTGFKIETVDKDASAGEDYSVYYDDGTGRLVVYRVSDDLVVFDNDLTTPVDRGEVLVSGYRHTGGGANIGSASSAVVLDAVASPAVYTIGTDGVSLSKMELYEKLYVAYQELKQQEFDAIVPMGVYLDDLNTVDQGSFIGAQPPFASAQDGTVYPTAGSFRPGVDVDSLGMVYIEEFEGIAYFWWRFASSGVTADLFPSIGDANATSKVDGTTLVDADFHEVNFGYQLGKFLYDFSSNIGDATGVISTLPPASGSLTDKARWVGIAPTLTLNTSTGLYYIDADDDGSGLLGNKFMAGMHAHRSGFDGGGFIATDTMFMDGTELVDGNDIPVDLGKYFSVVTDFTILNNGFSTTRYISDLASTYAGFYLNLAANSAPTNKRIPNSAIFYKISLDQINSLAGAGFVSLRVKSTGIVCADAPTAALSTSDWTRLSTMRIGKEVIDGIRAVVDPFLGEGLTAAGKASLASKVDNLLLESKKAGLLKDYRTPQILQTASQAVLGQLDINLVLVPAFELRQVSLTVSLAKS